MHTPKRYRASGVAVALTVLFTAAWPVPGHADAQAAPTATPNSGITLLTAPAPPPPGELTEAQGAAIDAAQNAATLDPDNLSYPYIDRTTGQIVVTAVTASGQKSAAAIAAGSLPTALTRRKAKPGQAALPLPHISIPGRSEAVKHSQRQLQGIMDDVIGRGLVTPGVTVIDDYPDPQRNQVVLEVDNAPADFLAALASRYDASAIAVRVIGAQPRSDVADTRLSDGSPFYGGDEIYMLNNQKACTGGFQWYSSTGSRYVVTAGHCASDAGGGDIGTFKNNFGDIGTYLSGWSWQTGSGSINIGGRYYGDVSIAKIYSQYTNTGRIYVGGSNSTTSTSVSAMWSRSPQAGDQFCTGGMASGEECGWVTQQAGGNFYYTTAGVCRHCSWSYMHSYNVIIPGDSGGPVYTKDSNGNAIAKGLISGYAGNNGNVVIYSDIWDAYDLFPGTLLTGG